MLDQNSQEITVVLPRIGYWGQDQVCFGYFLGLALGPGSGLFWIFPWPGTGARIRCVLDKPWLGTGARIRFVLDIPLAWFVFHNPSAWHWGQDQVCFR